MKLYMPTKVYNEKNCVENHSRELAALGQKPDSDREAIPHGSTALWRM